MKKTEMLHSIMIVRKEEQLPLGVYLKEFWMFCGIYVSEHIFVDHETLKDIRTEGIDILLNLTGNDLDMPDTKICTIIAEDYNLSTIMGRKNFSSHLKKMIASVAAEISWSDMQTKVFEQMIELFCKADYAKKNYCSHMFLNQMDANKTEEIGKMYLDCYGKLWRIIKSFQTEYKETVYLHLALLNCARKVNHVCRIREEYRIFNDGKLVAAAQELYRKYPDFSMANVIAGLVSVHDCSLWQEAESSFQQAIEQEKDRKYSLFIHYSLGHFYEMEKKNMEKAWEQYEYMLQIDLAAYRALFKMGCREFRKNNGKGASDYFSQVYEMMDQKVKGGWMQFLQLEYFYKCAYILANSSMVSKEYSGNIESVRKNIQIIKEQAFSQNQLAKVFIPSNQIKKYAKKFQDKMDAHRINKVVG